MAEEKDKKKEKFNEKKQKKVINKSDINSYIESDAYGMSLKQFEKDSRILDDLNEKIRNLLVESRKDGDQTINSMDRMFDLVKGSIDINERRSSLANINTTTRSGMRSIGDIFNTGYPEELKTIDMFEQNIKNSFLQMNEFRIIRKIIPELYKIIQNMTRDILNNNDTHKHFITEILKKKDIENTKENIFSDLNDELVEKVVKRNDLEKKIKKYVETALLTGAQPVAVIPYSDIRELLSERFDRTQESIESYFENISNSNSYYKPSIMERFMGSHNKSMEGKYTVKGEDDNDEIFTSESNIYDEILGNSVEEYFSLESDQYLKSIAVYDGIMEKDENKEKEINDIRAKFLDPNSDIVKIKKQEIKKEMLKMIHQIDQNIEIIDPVNSALALAQKTLKQSWKFRNYHNDGFILNVNADLERRDDLKNKFDISDEKDVYHSQIERNPMHKNKEKSHDNSSDDGLDDVLILEFDPENVIPIIVNGVHVDYYVIEDEAYDAGMGRNRKFSFSFMDVVKSLGIGDDQSMMGGNGLQGIASDGIPTNGIPMFGQQINMSSFSSSVSLNVQTEDALKRNEILRDIILRTISTKMENKDLIDNKVFRDCIMNLFRQGYVLKKKVQFTNIPASNMVYFAHNLSNNGLPASIYSDTLFYCYMYIMCVVSSALIKLAKSSYKDVVTFEVSDGNNFGVASQMIEHNLSTRQTHGFGTFAGIMNVLKNSVAHDRIVIPLVDGNKIYDYQQMEQMNDINIDDDFTEKILYKIIQQTSYPAAAINKLSEEEYARSIATQQLAYVDDLIEKQEIFGAQVTKLLKLCMKYTKFTETTKEIVKNNINKVDFAFAIPSKLFIENNTDLFSSIEQYSDMVTKIYWGTDADEEQFKYAVNEFKKNVAQIAATNIDWKGFDEIYKKALQSSTRKKLEFLKTQKINEEIDEKALDSGDDGFGGDSGGFGDTGGDDFGMGGDESGGDDGGFGDFNMDDMGGGNEEGGNAEDEDIQY